MSYVFLFTFFCHCRSFSPRWPLAFLIFSPPLQNFVLFLQQKMPPLFFLFRSSSFSRWASLACRRLTFSFSLPFSFSTLWRWQLIQTLYFRQQDTETISAFRFRLYWLFSCLCFTRRRRPCAFPPKQPDSCHRLTWGATSYPDISLSMVPCGSSPVTRVLRLPLRWEKRSAWGGGCMRRVYGRFRSAFVRYELAWGRG